MTERPILFSAPMVRALLEGRKTQTRRALYGKTGRVITLAKAQPGDRFYVREAIHIDLEGDGVLRYAADQKPVDVSNATDTVLTKGKLPSMFMPKWASRITLEVTGVRTERLQALTRLDAEAEGIEGQPFHWRDYLDPLREFSSPISSYASLWDSINGSGAWVRNPEVLVLSFQKVSS